MNAKSAAALEREAEAKRAKVAETAESLRGKMTPGQMIDELTGYLRDSDGSIALDNLRTQVRDNPLPLAMIGTGMAWLFLGGGPTSSDLRKAASDATQHGSDNSATREAWGVGSGGVDTGTVGGRGKGLASSATDTVGDTVTAASDAVSAAASKASHAASATAHRVGDAASEARRRTAESAHHVSEQAQHAADNLQKTLGDLYRQEPLIMGALGVAVGAAIGAMLPRTELEDKHVGPYREQLRERAEETVQEAVEEAKAVATETYEAAKTEADRQGLSPKADKPLAEKAKKVGETAARTAESSVREKWSSKSPSSS